MSQPLPPERTEPVRARSSTLLIILIVIAAVIVCLQYTSYALLPANKTSTLWGVLTGLIVGGLIFGWLRFSTRD
ncbi:MAG: hypothetical protein ABR585_11600 [Gemmatimonadaceae bacterium]